MAVVAEQAITLEEIEQTGTMKAVVREKYGLSELLERGDVEKPEVPDDGVLVRVRATSVNAVDWYDVAGRPWIARPVTGLRGPKALPAGSDFAGTVEAVGKDVSDLQPADDVFGAANGSFAEYVCAKAGVSRKPANLTFEQAAAVPVAGLTALQGLRGHGRLQPGQKVLVNGGSGGWAHSPSRSPRRSERRSLQSAARGMSSRRERWAPITSSITPRTTSPGTASATT